MRRQWNHMNSWGQFVNIGMQMKSRLIQNHHMLGQMLKAKGQSFTMQFVNDLLTMSCDYSMEE